MNFLPNDVNQFITEFAPNTTNAEVMIGAPFIYLERLLALKSKGVQVLSQDVSVHEKGAYTGEVSAEMLSALGVNGAIVGHSERRTYHNETDALIAKKVDACVRAGIIPVYCCGELLAEREAGRQEEIVGRQVREALSHLTKEQILKVVIAYEPVWAIGTGKTASPAQAQEVHEFIRDLIEITYSLEVANDLVIQYGGSVKPDNAKELLSQKDIDGALVGGACLKADSFMGIIKGA